MAFRASVTDVGRRCLIFAVILEHSERPRIPLEVPQTLGAHISICDVGAIQGSITRLLFLSPLTYPLL